MPPRHSSWQPTLRRPWPTELTRSGEMACDHIEQLAIPVLAQFPEHDATQPVLEDITRLDLDGLGSS